MSAGAPASPGTEKVVFVLLLLGKLSPRRRVLSGVVCSIAGALWVAVSAVAAPNLLIHGAVLALVGAVLWLSGVLARRRERPAPVVAGHPGER